MLLEAVLVTQKIKLNRVRTQVGLTQQKLADVAHVSKRVIARAEGGRYISQLTAWAILNALNMEREKHKLLPLDYEQLDWKVKGDGI